MLRLVSFNLDYYWACTSMPPPVLTEIDEESKVSFVPVRQQTYRWASRSQDVNLLNERSRVLTSHPLASYTFSNYLAYALYPPLYIAGPIITFNSFYSQIASPNTVSRKTLIGYGVRFVTCLLTMELVLHSMYIVAIKDSSKEGAWQGDTPFELSMIGFWNLIVVWLKVRRQVRFFPRERSEHWFRKMRQASYTVAMLPTLGIVGWNRPARKHGSMYGKQLLNPWILEILA